jgi:hypothetical protein
MKSDIGKTFSAYAHGNNLQGTLEGDNKRPVRIVFEVMKLQGDSGDHYIS